MAEPWCFELHEVNLQYITVSMIFHIFIWMLILWLLKLSRGRGSLLQWHMSNRYKNSSNLVHWTDKINILLFQFCSDLLWNLLFFAFDLKIRNFLKYFYKIEVSSIDNTTVILMWCTASYLRMFNPLSSSEVRNMTVDFHLFRWFIQIDFVSFWTSPFWIDLRVQYFKYFLHFITALLKSFFSWMM